jgi:alpha-galactosidase
MNQPQAQTATSSPAPGQVVLTGPPGAGKSTVARLLADRLSPSVHLHSDDVWHFIKQGWVAPGDPSADVLHPLIDAAAEAGAECFVIDAGWYANGGDWWVGVGEWQPSNGRFPNGINEVLDHIRRRGMVPGPWLEPEVVGVNSPVALKLPDSAFLQRDGVRVSDHGRYHLDFTADATVAFLDEVLDHLVNDHGVGYFKFDYNIRADVGSDANTANTASTGHGAATAQPRLSGMGRRTASTPSQVGAGNCASGGMRQDFATVSRFDPQSTSDQEDFHAYAPIAAAAPMLVLPEQAGNWVS